MPTFVEFELPTADTVLAGVFDRLPSAYCYLERTAGSGVPGLWFGGSEPSAIEAGLAADPSVDGYSRVSSRAGEWLYEIELADEACEIVGLFLADGGTVLEASADGGTWSVRMRFPDHESATRTYHRLIERGIDVAVASLRRGSTASPDRLGLTAEQYEALTTAIERGYYEVPREVSVQELADEFDISDQSVSERLRRASSRLISTALNPTATGARPDDR